MNYIDQTRTVVIVGAGLAGTATAIRLLQFAREPVRIVLIERRAGYRNAGSAYHRESNHWHHVFNIQAGRMSAFREDVDDFVSWANQEADRTGWPQEWSSFTFTESGPAPRRIYPDHLADRLAQAAGEAMEGVRLVEADGEVVDLEVHAEHVRVVVDNLALRPDAADLSSGPPASRAEPATTPTLAVLRVGVMAYTSEIVDAALRDQITVTTGKVDGIHGTDAGTLVVAVSGRQRIEADLVISNFGRESNYERADSTLWTNLLRKGIASVHRRTGRGVEVSNGRTGAFTFNLAAIKNHSVEVAASVLCRLETCYDDTAAPSIDATDPELDRAILLDVHRMTARRRDHRQAFATRLDRSIHDLTVRRGGIPATKHGSRYAITAAATAKLKDLSVTPRDLSGSDAAWKRLTEKQSIGEVAATSGSLRTWMP